MKNENENLYKKKYESIYKDLIDKKIEIDGLINNIVIFSEINNIDYKKDIIYNSLVSFKNGIKFSIDNFNKI
jgi:hypothetical protein